MAKKRIKYKYNFGGNFTQFAEDKPMAANAIQGGLGAIGGMLDSTTKKMEHIGDTGQKVNQAFGAAENTLLSGAAGPWGMLAGGISKGLRLPINAIVNAVKDNKRDPRHFEEFNNMNENIVQNPYGMAAYGMNLKYPFGGQIEAEGGETLMKGNGQIQNINGPSHAGGGVEMTPGPNDEYIFSDRFGPEGKKGETYADLSKKIEKKYKNKRDKTALDTKAFELAALKQSAEVQRQKIEGSGPKRQFSTGGYTYSQDAYTKWMRSNNPDNLNLKSQEAVDKFRPLYGQHLYDTYGAQAAHDFNKAKPFDFSKVNTGSHAAVGDPTILNPDSKFTGSLTTPPTRYDNAPGFVGPPMPPPSYFADAAKTGDVASVDTTTGKGKSPMSAGDKWQLAGMIPGLAYNAAQALRKPEQIGANLNPYASQVKSLFGNRRFNEQAMINDARMSYNAYKDTITNQSSSSATRNANLQKGLAGLTSGLNKARLQGQQINNQYRADEATALDALGRQDVAARNLQEQLQTETDARRQMFGSTAATQLGQAMSQFGQTKNQGLTNSMLADSLNNLTQNFSIGEIEDYIKQLKGIHFKSNTTKKGD